MNNDEGWIASNGLNWSQRNALAVTLEQLERSVGEIERLLDDAPAGASYVTVVDMSPETRQRFHEECQAIRSQIAELVAAFELPRRESNARQIIAAEMSVAWAHLEDLRPAKLRRYGEVDPALEKTLTPHLEHLIRLVLAVDALARVGE